MPILGDHSWPEDCTIVRSLLDDAILEGMVDGGLDLVGYLGRIVRAIGELEELIRHG